MEPWQHFTGTYIDTGWSVPSNRTLFGITCPNSDTRVRLNGFDITCGGATTEPMGDCHIFWYLHRRVGYAPTGSSAVTDQPMEISNSGTQAITFTFSSLAPGIDLLKAGYWNIREPLSVRFTNNHNISIDDLASWLFVNLQIPAGAPFPSGADIVFNTMTSLYGFGI